MQIVYFLQSPGGTEGKNTTNMQSFSEINSKIMFFSLDFSLSDITNRHCTDLSTRTETSLFTDITDV